MIVLIPIDGSEYVILPVEEFDINNVFARRHTFCLMSGEEVESVKLIYRYTRPNGNDVATRFNFAVPKDSFELTDEELDIKEQVDAKVVEAFSS